ncbi:unnamed protein product [Paramecium sonneborni]|uniref:DEAD/DEAH-box helicase domain-containing protein n=1 Tax=Paramecium sonneborni TaxID=65129 RepID=A0A8S1PUH9_9CILI|nr:unnamed protein product [Paramecium sonneborni]
MDEGRVLNLIREWNKILLPKNLMNSIQNLIMQGQNQLYQQVQKEILHLQVAVNQLHFQLIQQITYQNYKNRMNIIHQKMAPPRELQLEQEEQEFNLKKGIEMIIGTLGRINDFLMKKQLDQQWCSQIVLDEANKMIDLRFELDVNYFLDSITTQMKLLQIQKKNQCRLEKSMMKLKNQTKDFQETSGFIIIGEPEGGNKDIEQKIEMVKEFLLINSRNCQQKIYRQKYGVIIEAKYFEVILKIQQLGEASVDSIKSKMIDILKATDFVPRDYIFNEFKWLSIFMLQKIFKQQMFFKGFYQQNMRNGRARKRDLALIFLTNSNQDLFYDLKNIQLKVDKMLQLRWLNRPPQIKNLVLYIIMCQGKNKQFWRIDNI